MSFAVQALTRSLNVFHLGGSACNNCDIEILDALTPKYDLERFGIVLVGSVKHADVLLLAGVFNKKTRIRAIRVYEQAPKPIVVIAIGACACGGCRSGVCGRGVQRRCKRPPPEPGSQQ